MLVRPASVREAAAPRPRACQFRPREQLPTRRACAWFQRAASSTLLPEPHHGLGMTKKEYIPQLDRPTTVVLGELIFVKLREGRSQPLLHLSRERHTSVLPVDGNKLCEFIGTLEDACERLRHRRTVRLMTRHFADDQKRRVTQLHLLARLNGKGSHLLGPNLRHSLGDASGDLDPVLVELALPKETRKHRAAQLHLRRDVACGRVLVRARCSVEIQCVQSGHVFLTFNARRLRHQRLRMNSSSSVFMYASLPGIQDRTNPSPDSRRACNSSFSRPSNRPPIAQHVSGAPIFRSAAKTFGGKDSAPRSGIMNSRSRKPDFRWSNSPINLRRFFASPMKPRNLSFLLTSTNPFTNASS